MSDGGAGRTGHAGGPASGTAGSPASDAEHFAALVDELQGEIRAALEEADGRARFAADRWQRPGGGGGLTRPLEGGELLERAAVNVSHVHGELPPSLLAKMGGGPAAFSASGLSLILHPRSPMVPIVHLNVRRIVKGDDVWFGGGADLTPCYLEPDDVRHFHRVLAGACAAIDPGAYGRYKTWCDTYFHIRHRGESRGVGGIFFDDLRVEPERGLRFAAAVGRALVPAWLPIAQRRRGEPWGEREQRWQRLRRGRYVEFNLVYDRGTLFGLETGGRTESVLASLPPLAAWEYAHEPEPGSREAELLAVLRAPRDWL